VVERFRPLAPQNRSRRGDSAHFEKRWSILWTNVRIVWDCVPKQLLKQSE